jgi:protease-4
MPEESKPAEKEESKAGVPQRGTVLAGSLYGILAAEMGKRIWAMDEKMLTDMTNEFRRLAGSTSEIRVELIAAAKEKAKKRSSQMVVADGTAVISITGILLKNLDWLLMVFGIDQTSYRDIVANIRDALADKSVKRILLLVDSPGGEVRSLEKASDAIYEARQVKEVAAHIDDLSASGAYWLASQAGKISANRNAMLGSIGVYSVLYDASEMAAKEGIKVHVIRSGEHKGADILGAEVSEKQIKGIQEMVDDVAANFISEVARGRGMSQSEVKKLATGQVWLAGKAKKNGLIDAIGSLEETLSAGTASGNKSLEGGDVVAEKDQEKEVKVEVVDEAAMKAKVAEGVRSEDAKRLAGLKVEFAEEPDFVLEQYSKGATVEAAKAAYSDVLKTRLEETEKEKAELEKKLAGKAVEEGAEGVDSQGTIAGGGETDFVKAAVALAEEKGITKTAAMQKLAADDPEMFAAWKASQKRVPKK